MDNRRFRRSKNIEDRRSEAPRSSEETTGEKLERQLSYAELAGSAKNKSPSKLATDLGFDDVQPETPFAARWREAASGDQVHAPPASPTAGGTDMAQNTAVQQFASMPKASIQDAIRRAAEEQGIDPATALAYADRESSFNPGARSSKTIHGLFQMTGPLRQKYGIGDSTDPYQQTMGWAGLLRDNKATMSAKLGRDVTDAEAYAGHHFGAGRAARMFQMHPDTPVDQVFTRNELAQNPHIGRAGTVGAILGDVTGDIDRRRSKFGGAGRYPP
jgi:hypothetical protein